MTSDHFMIESQPAVGAGRLRSSLFHARSHSPGSPRSGLLQTSQPAEVRLAQIDLAQLCPQRRVTLRWSANPQIGRSGELHGVGTADDFDRQLALVAPVRFAYQFAVRSPRSK